MAALRPNHVDLAEGRIYVRENVSEVEGRLVWGPPKTRRGRRSVILPEEVMVELAHHMETSPGDDTVFGAPNGGVLRATSWRRRYWHPAVEKAGLTPLRPYDLRHTAIALWIEAGGNMLEFYRRAGHSSVSFTLDRYGHLFPDAEAGLSQRLSGLYQAPPQLSVVAPIEEEEIVPAASPRPEGADVIMIDNAKQPLTRDASSGASKNRTYDLSIISAAL
jgi:integrase